MKKIAFMLLATTITTGMAHAELSDYLPKFSNYLPEAKISSHAVGKGYVGFGMSQELVHGNAEWVTPYGIAYGKLGAFIKGGNEAGGQLGFRYPYYLTGTDANGYYFGVYGGHLDTISLDGKEYQRLGAGVDLAYVLLSKARISSLSVGIGSAEKVVGSAGTKKEMGPQLQVAYSLSFNVF